MTTSIPIKVKISGLGVVYDKDGKIKIDNYHALSDEHKAILDKLLEQENCSNTRNDSA